MAERPFSIPDSTTPNSGRKFPSALVWPRVWDTSLFWVIGIACSTVMLHLATGWRYGFDRDELMALEDARHLAWGYVQYPPMLPFFARIALLLFGTSLVGFRLFAALAQAIALVLTGLMAREISDQQSAISDLKTRTPTRSTTSTRRVNVNGSAHWAAVVATLAGVPFCLGGGALMQYISFDYLCWVLVAYCMVRLLKSDDARWWIGVGAAIGFGFMAKYTMAFFAAGVVVGVLLAPARKFLRSVWLWAGVLTSAAITAPNLWWQWKRHFVSLEFLRFIHARDVQQGLTNWFLAGQVELTMLALPLAMVGLWFLLFSERGRLYRPLAWMYLVPLALFLVMRGRAYYLAPAYPMLYGAGAVWLGALVKREGSDFRISNFHFRFRVTWLRIISQVVWVALIVDITIAAAVALPIAPVNSAWWKLAARVDPIFPEEIGWQEFVATVAGVRDRLPPTERNDVAILAGNYGELGALNLYGGRYRLPAAIGGENSSWERGYGTDPETVIVTGYSRQFLEQHFASCEVGARVWNRYGVSNEEIVEDPTIYVCRGLKESWPGFWVKLRKFA